MMVVSPSTRRRTVDSRSDDAPETLGTAFADAAEAPPTGLVEPDWLHDAPLPGEQPPELSPDVRRLREAEQERLGPPARHAAPRRSSGP